MITNFSIFKAKKSTESSPDYNISAKVGEQYVNIGACWLKEGKSGKYFSCKLQGAYGERKGYKIVTEATTLTEEEKAKIASARAGEATKVEVVRGEGHDSHDDVDGIPF